ncbi:ChaN family lipoprotein [Limnothrix sp. FACHB-881]|uniref:ChaN family lipoprotein n=1 Tax=Limnothrix sp. FACHB-881 TaxID=2692819 RepID=UPI00168568B7|nr:ChaN family lipoprotein [Limnothrix sp. FACHB-881]MBD2635786.1 ChaN family lipoprotein [Limnothrix sp. FACHB-881]
MQLTRDSSNFQNQRLLWQFLPPLGQWLGIVGAIACCWAAPVWAESAPIPATMGVSPSVTDPSALASAPVSAPIAIPATPNPQLAQDLLINPGDLGVFDRFWADLAGSQVIYLGEVHDRSADVPIKLEVIHRTFQQVENFSRQGQPGRLVIALEMFQQPFQSALDDYLAGRIDEATLRDRTEFDQRWGFDWEIIAPILRWARDRGVAVVALNLPAEVTRQIGRQGWDALPAEAWQWLPPPNELQLGSAGYRAWLREIYDEIHQQHGASAQSSAQSSVQSSGSADRTERFNRFLAAQAAWDETMAAGIARLLQRPGDRVVTILGRGHMVYGWGVPDRLARRKPDVVQRSILLGPLEAPEIYRDGRSISHYWWPSARSAP